MSIGCVIQSTASQTAVGSEAGGGDHIIEAWLSMALQWVTAIATVGCRMFPC